MLVVRTIPYSGHIMHARTAQLLNHAVHCTPGPVLIIHCILLYQFTVHCTLSKYETFKKSVQFKKLQNCNFIFSQLASGLVFFFTFWIILKVLRYLKSDCQILYSLCMVVLMIEFRNMYIFLLCIQLKFWQKKTERVHL